MKNKACKFKKIELFLNFSPNFCASTVKKTIFFFKWFIFIDFQKKPSTGK